jgi:hypothetical protein
MLIIYLFSFSNLGSRLIGNHAKEYSQIWLDVKGESRKT